MFDFKGILSQFEYWIPKILFISIEYYIRSGPEFLVLTYGIALVIATISAGVRRLHDAGFSGLFMFLAFIPLGNLIGFILLLMPSQKVNNKFLENEK